jgi:ArsR family transcriptional regulator, cadmium/lead-responsive transcriptional repressor
MMDERSTLPLVPELRFDLERPDVRDAVRLGALVGDPVRAGILAILRDGPHCVCEMAAALGERQNNVSNHLAKLREAGLVRASRHGADARWVYYERDEAVIEVAARAMAGILR